MTSPTAARRLTALLPQPSDWAAARRDPRRDLVAGLTVAVVALPLALAFGATSGLGAQAGLVTAIVAGAVAAVFGGSNLQVSGPTGAMTVVLVPLPSALAVAPTRSPPSSTPGPSSATPRHRPDRPAGRGADGSASDQK